MAKRVCCLYRVSTGKQVDYNGNNEADIPMQRKACHKFALEKGWNIDMDRVRSAIPAEIPDEEMEDYTEKALEYYQQLLQKRKARDAR